MSTIISAEPGRYLMADLRAIRYNGHTDGVKVCRKQPVLFWVLEKDASRPLPMGPLGYPFIDITKSRNYAVLDLSTKQIVVNRPPASITNDELVTAMTSPDDFTTVMYDSPPSAD